MRFNNKFFLLATCCGVVAVAGAMEQRIDDLSVDVYRFKEFSFSDKAAGFYYGNSKADDFSEWYAGWNIRAKRIFSDYALFADGKELSRKDSKVEMFPYKLVRDYGVLKEEFALVDERKVLFVYLNDAECRTVGLKLEGNVENPKIDGNSVIYTPVESSGDVVRVAAVNKQAKVALQDGLVTAAADCGGFIVTFGSEKESKSLLSDAQKDGLVWLAQRKARMQRLIDNNIIKTQLSICEVSNDLMWLILTSDELVTRQHGGWGIYAGFPWFTDFWGRDMFISMPGTVLCTGQFDVACDILLSFAKYQDLDSKSETYGRVPNRLNLDGILYNTTDGTPRFVMQIYDYLKYTGDKDFVKKIYKNVKIATDASLERYTDESGYLVHADADTWMDAKRQGKYPCSPRGDRAVDIQALWYEQLVDAASLADMLGKQEDAARWNNAAARLKSNFEKDFVNEKEQRLYDHLNADGTPDLQLRPNSMYAYDLLSDSALVMNDLRNLWTRLVYPWGVSTLDQDDDQFHPYHEQWTRYHKDDAYHNGTVWLWLNGEAMQRMIEFNQEDKAFMLLKSVLQNARIDGAVGSLSECVDAWCRPGKTRPKLSGTFLQAWSNAEQIRVWNQYFMGIRPDMLNGRILINPKIPSQISEMQEIFTIGDGKLEFEYENSGDGQSVYTYKWSAASDDYVMMEFDLGCFENFKIALSKNEVMKITVGKEHLFAKLFNESGSMRATVQVDGLDDSKVRSKEQCDAFFKNAEFAEPSYRENLKSMSRYFDPPLDYQSVE